MVDGVPTWRPRQERVPLPRVQAATTEHPLQVLMAEQLKRLREAGQGIRTMTEAGDDV